MRQKYANNESDAGFQKDHREKLNWYGHAMRRDKEHIGPSEEHIGPSEESVENEKEESGY